MQVTNIKIIESKMTGSKLKAFVDITLDEQVVLKGFKVIDGINGLFCAPPSEQAKDGKYYDRIMFVDGNKRGSVGDQFRQYMQTEVLKAYAELRASTQSFNQTESAPALDDGVPF